VAARLREAIVGATGTMDERALDAALDATFAALSPEAAMDDILVPAAREIGDLWAAGRLSVAAEHLASARVAHRLHRLVDAARIAAPDAPRAICACFPDEEHEVGALVVAYHLSRAGWRTTWLGARLPFEDLERACALVSPGAAFLSVTREALYQTWRPALLDLLGRLGGRVRVYVGGAGAPETDAALTRAGARLWPQSRPLAALPADAAAHPAGAGPRRRSR
jgi:methanogenic corrinoid protein MtbC1